MTDGLITQVAIEDHFGPVSLLVNNAGNSGTFAPLRVVDPDAWWNDIR